VHVYGRMRMKALGIKPRSSTVLKRESVFLRGVNDARCSHVGCFARCLVVSAVQAYGELGSLSAVARGQRISHCRALSKFLAFASFEGLTVDDDSKQVCRNASCFCGCLQGAALNPEPCRFHAHVYFIIFICVSNVAACCEGQRHSPFACRLPVVPVWSSARLPSTIRCEALRCTQLNSPIFILASTCFDALCSNLSSLWTADCVSTFCRHYNTRLDACAFSSQFDKASPLFLMLTVSWWFHRLGTAAATSRADCSHKHTGDSFSHQGLRFGRNFAFTAS
jgi:hypothetical protein